MSGEVSEGQLRYLKTRRDYGLACDALTALTGVVMSLVGGDVGAAKTGLDRTIAALASVEREMPALASCETLAALLVEATTETKKTAWEMVRMHFLGHRPTTLEALQEIAAVVCLEQLMKANAGAWVNEGNE